MHSTYTAIRQLSPMENWSSHAGRPARELKQSGACTRTALFCPQVGPGAAFILNLIWVDSLFKVLDSKHSESAALERTALQIKSKGGLDERTRL